MGMRSLHSGVVVQQQSALNMLWNQQLAYNSWLKAVSPVVPVRDPRRPNYKAKMASIRAEILVPYQSLFSRVAAVKAKLAELGRSGPSEAFLSGGTE